ncbi:phosphate starvation-inducible protein [Bajunvirus bajun]|uniref:PhoH-like protein n=1 Tax=Brevundimonas phage vB_BgoS-Bajun TaxID=2948594 RepID=A0A9E7N4S5_9CAUD|nr:phosphate starvation-inducible protein [Brevundimonas phage vB_BgoS-Bajun]
MSDDSQSQHTAENPVFEPRSPSPKAAKRQAKRADKTAKSLPPGHLKPLVAKTEKQKRYIQALTNGDSAFAVGGAGTGKTYIAGRKAARALVEGRVEKIILTRVTVSSPRHALGFLPGKLEQKMAPWIQPMIDGIRDEVSPATLEQWTAAGKFEVVAFEHMRGRTFRDSFVILDEAQNATYGDLQLFLTRIGENAQVVVTGDMDQIDIRDSGLERILNLCDQNDVPMHIIEFGEEDVVRSPMAKAWVKAFGADKRLKAANQDAPEGSRQAAADVANLDTLPGFVVNGGRRELVAA